MDDPDLRLNASSFSPQTRCSPNPALWFKFGEVVSIAIDGYMYQSLTYMYLYT